MKTPLSSHLFPSPSFPFFHNKHNLKLIFLPNNCEQLESSNSIQIRCEPSSGRTRLTKLELGTTYTSSTRNDIQLDLLSFWGTVGICACGDSKL